MTGETLRALQVSIFDALMKTTIRDEGKMDITTLFEEVADKLKGLNVVVGALFRGIEQAVLVNSDLIATYFIIGLLVMRDETKNKAFKLTMEVTESERIRFQLSAEIEKEHYTAQTNTRITYYNQVIGDSDRAGGLNCYAEMESDKLVVTVIHPMKIV